MTALLTRFLAPDLYAAVFAHDLVLLDLRSGDYELLAGAAAYTHLTPDRRSLAFANADTASEFAELGLLAPERSCGPRLDVQTPGRSALDAVTGPLGISERVWMMRGWAQMIRYYYGRSFPRLITTARSATSCAAPKPISEQRLIEKSRAFHQLSVWTPFAGDCLFRCFMLLRLLGAEAGAADWVFGVRTWPFLAHCWLQSGDLVLTDAAEQVALFSPILVV